MRDIRSPTLTTLLLLLAVFVVQSVATGLGLRRSVFSLSLPLAHHPWTIVTTVYAHDSLAHLAANAIGLGILGVGIERTTTPARFHAFFLGTGVLAAVTEVLVWGALGERVAIVGASGAVLALFGYAMVGNPLSRTALSRLGLGPRGESVLFVGLAALITLAAAAPRVALVAHFVGLLIGILAGRTRLLHPDPSGTA
jgi:membrane associated rhomboid family serine protease